ncbi:hypothetical protein [Pseudoxanthomonas sp. SGT-18]|uniref:hypothetical protein n=1 Tax=Pseudoxanthomonas sp. SGT-18 TaxID=2493087 RepID=UPI000F62BFF0|nr:hypothetical protein [Pseudoxanthomonas sp. SGT-18]
MNTRTTVHVDTLFAETGAISFGYTPETDRIYISVADPTDKRRATHLISLSQEDLVKFKALLERLDEVIKQEKAKLYLSKTRGSGFDQSGDVVSIPIGDSNISITKELYSEVSSLVNQGQTLVAASRISSALPWLGLPGARAVAQSICDYQQAIGDRT